MKYIFYSTFFLCLTVFTPFAFAHGGFEKKAGNVVVYINQRPVSPLVGETVSVFLTFRDESKPIKTSINDQELSRFPFVISVIDTYYGDAKKDKIIYQTNGKTDENGDYSFSYTFHKENYFDLHLRFIGPEGKLEETGFLIQPRSPKSISFPFLLLLPVCFLLLGIIVGRYITSFRSLFSLRKNNRKRE